MTTELLRSPDDIAVLVGVSRFEDPSIEDLPAVLNSLRAMRNMLVDPRLGGWQSHQVHVLLDPEDAQELALELVRLTSKVTGTLLLYFVGHGLLTPDAEFCLAPVSAQGLHPEFTCLEYRKVRSILLDCPARTKFVILDCCYSGRAQALGPTDAVQIADITEVRGTVTLSAADRAAHVVPGLAQAIAPTSFTGELVGLVERGLPGSPSPLTLAQIYPVLRERLRSSGLPLPNLKSSDTATQFALARNTAAHRRADANPSETPTTPLDASKSAVSVISRRGLMMTGAAVLSVALVTGAPTHWWGLDSAAGAGGSGSDRRSVEQLSVALGSRNSINRQVALTMLGQRMGLGDPDRSTAIAALVAFLKTGPGGMRSEADTALALTALGKAGLGFAQADLSGTDLSGVHVRGLTFPKGLPLYQTKLNNAEITNTQIAYSSNAQHVSLAGAWLGDCTLESMLMIGADLTNLNAPGTTFDRCTLSQANLTGADFSASTFRDCDFDGHTLIKSAQHRPPVWDAARPPTWPKGFTPPSGART